MNYRIYTNLNTKNMEEDKIQQVRDSIKKQMDRSIYYLVDEILERYDIRTTKEDIQFIKTQIENRSVEDFSAEEIIKNSTSKADKLWKETQNDLSELYKQVLIANASINNTPELVADISIESYKKKFNIDQ